MRSPLSVCASLEWARKALIARESKRCFGDTLLRNAQGKEPFTFRDREADFVFCVYAPKRNLFIQNEMESTGQERLQGR